MARKLAPGIELLTDKAGSGAAAAGDCHIFYSVQMFLRRGEDVTRDAKTIARANGRMPTAVCDGAELIRQHTILGKRQPIAGIEKSLYGMQAGGFREVLISPHLGYGNRGVPGVIPPNALLRVRIWVHEVECEP